MRKGFRFALIVAAITLGACTTTKQFSDSQFSPPTGRYRLVVMQPDISVGVLTAGGSVEPREDWTNEARKNIGQALIAQQRRRGGEAHISTTLAEAGADPVLTADLLRLHAVVGDSIRLHLYDGPRLPAKKNKLDWTLGEQAVAYGAATQYDYALFLYAQDTFSSSGRVALQAAATLACLNLVCNVPDGGTQNAFASLVDLRTGRIVWFNVLSSSVGDIRKPEGAESLVSHLLNDMKPGASRRAARNRPSQDRPR